MFSQKHKSVTGNLPKNVLILGEHCTSLFRLGLRFLNVLVLVTYDRKQWSSGRSPPYSGSKHFIKRLVSQKLIVMWWDFAPKTTDFPKNTSPRDWYLRYKISSSPETLINSGLLTVTPIPKKYKPKSTMSEGNPDYPHLGQTFYPRPFLFVYFLLVT